MKLFLSKDIKTDDKETVLLAILNGMYSTKQEYLITSIGLIGHEMTGRFLKTSIKRERVMINGVKEAMKSLIDKGVIEVIDQNNDDYVLSPKGLEVNTEKEHFVIVEQWEMQRIFERANKPFNVFSFFCCLLGTINSKTKEWHMSQDEMVIAWRYGKETINSYLEQLEEMQLIYIYRHKKRRTDGTYQKLNNSYGRYADKDSIIKAAQEYAESVECADFIEHIDRRAIKLRYNAYCNGAKKYKDNPDAVVALYKECELYNKSLKRNPVEGVYDGEWKQGEPLDLSVFPDYVVNGDMKVSDETGDWGEHDPMENDISVENNESVVCDLKSEGVDPKIDGKKFDCETVSQISSERNDLDLIDIESIFEDKPA